VRSLAITQKNPDVSAATIDDLVGGFGEDDTDNSYKRQAASQVTKKGRQPVKVCYFLLCFIELIQLTSFKVYDPVQ
jgi:hypothetical protein